MQITTQMSSSESLVTWPARQCQVSKMDHSSDSDLGPAKTRTLGGPKF